MRSPTSIERTITMATTDTTADIVITDDAVIVDGPNHSFGQEIAKTLVTSIATTAGMVGGMLVVGLVAGKVRTILENRAAQKDAPKVHVVTDMPETPETENN